MKMISTKYAMEVTVNMEEIKKEYDRLMRRIEEKLADVNCYITKAEADRRDELERLLGIYEE